MVTLNLTAEGAEQTILKEYLESNVSDVLADKINNGVSIVKDGKTLISKKDLTSFMSYAYEEAKKQAEKGARYACLDHKTVFGWAIHYFEENSLEGKLYNEDGTEYKPPKPVVTAGEVNLLRRNVMECELVLSTGFRYGILNGAYKVIVNIYLLFANALLSAVGFRLNG